MSEKLKGLWPAIFTPVDEGGKLQVKELEKLIELLITQQVDGLYLLGSTGQGFLFSEQERKEIADISISIVSKRLPVMVQVGALSTDESVRLAKHAYTSGADAVSSVGPIYYGASEEMAYQHYKKIAGATSLPFFPYQIGKAAGTDLINRLMKIENIAGMKLTTQNMLEIASVHQLSGNNWQLFSGADELFCHASLCGTAGAIGTTYNLLGATCKLVRQEFLNGQVELGTEFMLALQSLIEEIIPVIWTFFRRAMILKHNIDIGNVKAPLLTPEIKWTDDEVLDKINHLENIADKMKMFVEQN